LLLDVLLLTKGEAKPISSFPGNPAGEHIIPNRADMHIKRWGKRISIAKDDSVMAFEVVVRVKQDEDVEKGYREFL